jgi:hypothetical protein
LYTMRTEDNMKHFFSLSVVIECDNLPHSGRNHSRIAGAPVLIEGSGHNELPVVERIGCVSHIGHSFQWHWCML